MAHVLIVDDDSDAVDLLLDMLGKEHEAVGTSDGGKALEMLRAAPFDLLITDVRMPPPNGFTLIRMAREIQPALATVVISAYYSQTDPDCRAIVEGFAPVALSKPFTTPVVKAAVDAALLARG